jgi:Zn-dependent protease with chaperone function
VSAPPGWYPDPQWMGRERYWDGQTWTEQSRVWEGRSSSETPQTAPLSTSRTAQPTLDSVSRGLAPSTIPPDLVPAQPAPSGGGIVGATNSEASPRLASPRRKQGHGSGAFKVVATLLALVPVVACEAAVLAPIAYGLHLAWPVWGAVALFVAWWSLALLLSASAPQRMLMRLLYGGRVPTRDEQARLQGPWDEVLQHLGRLNGRLSLMVVDSAGLNACTPVGRIIPVTANAANSLPTDQLRAALAHELGHKIGWRTVPAFVHTQLRTPSRSLWWLLRTLWSPVGPMWRRAVAWHRPIGFVLVFLLVVIATAVTVVTALPAVAAYGASAATRLSARQTEARADELVVLLGLGNELLAAVEHHIDNGHSADAEAPSPLPAHLVQRAQHLRRILAARTAY